MGTAFLRQGRSKGDILIEPDPCLESSLAPEPSLRVAGLNWAGLSQSFPSWSVEFRRFRCRVKSGRLAARFLTPRHSSAGASLRCVPVARNAPNARFSGFGREKRAYVARVARNARLRAGFSLRIRAFGADLAIHRRKSAHLACFSPHSPRFLAERQHARTLCAELASTKKGAPQDSLLCRGD